MICCCVHDLSNSQTTADVDALLAEIDEETSMNKSTKVQQVHIVLVSYTIVL